MRLAPALAVALALLALPPAASAQVTFVGPHPGPELTEGPQLTGPRVAWAQTRCLTGCDTDFPSETSALFQVRAAGELGPGRRLFRARTSGAFSGPNFGYDRYSFLASTSVVATVHVTLSGDELEGESGRAVLRAGATAPGFQVLADCSAAFFTGAVPVALDGSRIAYDPDPCDELPRLVVRDLVEGGTVALPEPAGGPLLSLRGNFVAWVEGGGAAARLVVHDLAAGRTAYSAPAADVLALDVDAEGYRGGGERTAGPALLDRAAAAPFGRGARAPGPRPRLRHGRASRGRPHRIPGLGAVHADPTRGRGRRRGAGPGPLRPRAPRGVRLRREAAGVGGARLRRRRGPLHR